MGISKNNGTPQIIHFNRVFHYKPSILGTPIFGNIHIMYIEYAGISHQVNTVLKEKLLLLKVPNRWRLEGWVIWILGFCTLSLSYLLVQNFRL